MSLYEQILTRKKAKSERRERGGVAPEPKGWGKRKSVV
jgi:hypothetical protein